ncbi:MULTISPECIES: ABC transporter ATP-binding protein/permease [Streptomyces]|uniref:ABC transporter ATP-binding protein n=1 Tax=Streptomyces tsukubensis (strain DSM 42081 / NBRC 108919 / NRRL 18488 / 9993) TaxID=1114943 RepID=I2MTY8_STRT9|nr:MULTISPECIES: FHA domain-containing protein [Streptomyces]AZK92791.1 ABC transporter ATP-binding protein [Streptomyces tsukubensis]EIF88235.1 ABC transporter ATP-binding protein [Streptomyces tsukubensis NRRL18488]MYS64888.1 FHA domain-containing protein [Streptomyces sp. SID5473]QKM71045.1 ABC transporter ATP-binding protein [Streptomyces tsukubensis NRRL18488]TAI41699.1 FHA domain-containing protein [Streptomyces tsukubensis]
MAERRAAPTAPDLVIETDDGSTVMHPGRAYQVGRDPLCDIVFDDDRVSWHHAVLRADADHWTVEDEHSTNGTYADGLRVRSWDVGAGSELRFGSATDGPRAVLVDRAAPAPARTAHGPAAAEHPGPHVSVPAATGTFRHPTSVRPRPARTVRIGRASDNDLVVDDLTVSRHHAELRSRPDGTYEIADIGSHNGTFLNGVAVTVAAVAEGDVVGIGHSDFCLIGDELQEYVDTGEVTLDVQELTVTVDRGRRTLLDRVTFPVPERCLLAVVGPSGAGKSTLLNALTGLRPADGGAVLYDGRDLYRDYAELRQRIGLVPQDDILHTQLTVRAALGYAAELRFPQDTGKEERRGRVSEVIRELGLGHRAQQPVHRLSGGQRKRVSVALELLTKPSLLFLDEPTSGLDPGMDRSVMQMLRTLADDGRTVVVVTHSVLSLDVCDRLLVLAPGGRTAYYGPPDEALGFFGHERWPEAFAAFENEPDRDWAGDYAASEHHRRYVTEASAQPPPEATRGPVRPAPPPAKPRSRSAQLWTLVRRYTAALSADRTFLVVMIALPFVMGAMARALAGSALTRDTAMNALLILCVGGVLTGSANAVRELVKERAIYRRERAVGLSRGAYLLSKVVVLGTVTVLQAVVLTLIGLAGVRLNAPGGSGVLLPPLVELTLAVALLSFTAMMLGLLISALVSKEEVTMPLLVLLAIVQVVFCGALLELHGLPVAEQLAWLVPSRWALAAMAATVGLGRLVPGALTADPLFEHSAAVWLLDMGMMVVLSVLYGWLVALLLRRQEPSVMRK